MHELSPAWMDLGTTDVVGAVDFYRDRFGWTIENGSDDAADVAYWLCTAPDGAWVAGLGPLTTGHQERPWWDLHLGTTDLERSSEHVVRSGARMLADPLDIPGLGRLAVFEDPVGGQFRLIEGVDAHYGDRSTGLLGVLRRTTSPDDFRKFARVAFGWRSDAGPHESSVPVVAVGADEETWIPAFSDSGTPAVEPCDLPRSRVLADNAGALFAVLEPDC